MKRLQTKDFDLVVSGGNRTWLQAKMDELAGVWADVVKMDQLADVSLVAGTKNNVFIFQNQIVNIYPNERRVK